MTEKLPRHHDIYVSVGAVLVAGFFGVGLAYLLDEPPATGVVVAVGTAFAIMFLNTHYPAKEGET